MPHAQVKITPGVDQNETPALNQAGLSFTNLVRFVPDRNGIGLVQKLGGWLTYFPNKIGSIVRALWAWEDTNSKAWLAAGAEYGSGNSSTLNVINNGNLINITPRVLEDNVTPVSVSTTSGSNLVTINDPSASITSYDSVFIKTQISVGGLILYGFYPAITLGSGTFDILATNVLGGPAYATSTVTDGGAVPLFTVTSGSASVTVTLNNHGYVVGNTFPVLVSTTVGGITFFGNYVIQSITDANNFVITASTTATSSTTGSENGGSAQYDYYIGIGPVPAGTGYGIGGYGTGGYGAGTAIVPTTGNAIQPTDWTMDNWGQILIACPVGGAIYYWDPTSGNPIATVDNAGPVVNDGIFVAMPQRQIVAWGSTLNGVQDPLLVRWSDINDFTSTTSWIALSTNQSGSYRLPKGSKIVGAIQAQQQGLIWTDIALWSMQYINQPYIYSFNELGTGCGLISRKAAASLNNVVYWMGQSQFWTYSSGGVTPLACPIWDVIFQDLDQTHLSKIRVAVNSQFGEISWFYPNISDGGEVNSYVKYNVVLGQWDFGSLSRTAWINQSVLGPPIGASSDQYIYQHETSPDAAYNGVNNQPLAASFQTGYFALTEANVKNFIDQVWPDMKWGYYNGESNGGAVYQNPTANVNLTFYVADYAGQTPKQYGPYQLNQATDFISPRFRGRLVSLQINSNDVGSWWRLGGIRYRFQPDGKY
jgi:hypothetical protein